MRFVLASVLSSVLMFGCGDDGDSGSAPGIEGDWEVVTFSTEEVSVSCPGVADATVHLQISCGSEALTLERDNSFVRVRITDELGNPDPWRTEGTWSTEGSMLTMETEWEGTDADNLQPVDPPGIFPFAWSVSETTLTLWFPFAADTLTSTYVRK